VTDPSQERSVQPKISPDGKWVWDGHNWVENPHPAPPQKIPEYPAPFPPAHTDPPRAATPPVPPPVPPGPPRPAPPGAPTTIAPTPPWTPPKKSNTLRNIVLSCAVLVILMVAGCAVFITVAVKEVGDQVDKQIARAGGDGSQGKATTVDPGAAFRLDGLPYKAGWRLAENDVGMLEVRRLRFENTRTGETTVVLRFEVLRSGDVVATMHCTSGQVPTGRVGKLTCLGADPRPEQYDAVRVTDLF
jgi:hypothetical protein